jgi:hypothetical protein
MKHKLQGPGPCNNEMCGLGEGTWVYSPEGLLEPRGGHVNCELNRRLGDDQGTASEAPLSIGAHKLE